MLAVAVDLEPAGGLDEVAELGVAEGAGVELGREVLQPLADGAELEPALGVLLELLDRLVDQLDRLAPSGAATVLAAAGLPASRDEVLGEDEAGAGLAEALRRLGCWPMP